MDPEIVCENYEITIGEEGAGVALTFDLDDLPEKGKGLAHVHSLKVDEQGFHASFSAGPGTPPQVSALFPTHEEMAPLVADIRQQYGRLYVVALGPGEEEGTSAVIFAGEMLLA